MNEAIEKIDDLIERIQYLNITQNQIIGKLADIKHYLEP